jgi:hypothetical protein
MDPHYGSALAQLLEANRSLASNASPFRQLEELIARPYANVNLADPILVVMDALDEGADAHFLEAIETLIHQLPKRMRLFFTTRPDELIMSKLSRWPRTRYITIDLEGMENFDDIATYSRFRLAEVAISERRH